MCKTNLRPRRMNNLRSAGYSSGVNVWIICCRGQEHGPWGARQLSVGSLFILGDNLYPHTLVYSLAFWWLWGHWHCVFLCLETSRKWKYITEWLHYLLLPLEGSKFSHNFSTFFLQIQKLGFCIFVCYELVKQLINSSFFLWTNTAKICSPGTRKNFGAWLGSEPMSMVLPPLLIAYHSISCV